MAARPGRKVKFVKAQVGRASERVCQAFVEVEHASGERFVGTAEGTASEPASLECTAEATLRALCQAVEGDERGFQLRGIETVRALGGKSLVVVELSVTHEGETRGLLGVAAVGSDPARAAALAVLSAANRFLGVG
ncbi:MAG: hypothetical protein ACREN5_09045 [Gemmatimonadales bacterium]